MDSCVTKAMAIIGDMYQESRRREMERVIIHEYEKRKIRRRKRYHSLTWHWDERGSAETRRETRSEEKERRKVGKKERKKKKEGKKERRKSHERDEEEEKRALRIVRAALFNISSLLC